VGEGVSVGSGVLVGLIVGVSDRVGVPPPLPGRLQETSRDARQRIKRIFFRLLHIFMNIAVNDHLPVLAGALVMEANGGHDSPGRSMSIILQCKAIPWRKSTPDLD
jgi:hypothetical protein